MNKADQDAGNKAVDSLINYETVKVSIPYTFVLMKQNIFSSCQKKYKF